MENQSALFVTCATALEPLLLDELNQLGIDNVYLGFRGVYVERWDMSTVYKINYASRLATRVLLPLTRFKCFDARALYRGASLVDWSAIIKDRETIAIDSNVHHRDIRNSLFAAQVVKDAICDQLRQKAGWRPSVNVQDPDVQLNLYIQNNMAIICFDTSGLPLHKRGYRQESVEAPMQETLAAAVLHLANYYKDEILFDPCCGSGTILIEAALMASNTPPGYLRHKWGFMRHPWFNQLEWLKVRAEIDKNRIPLEPGHLFGIDNSKDAIRVAKINLKAAGFLREVDVRQGDLREYTPEVTPSLIIANPPYGKRMDEEERLRPLYRTLGEMMKKWSKSDSGRGFVFTGNLELAKEVGLAPKRRHVLSSGGIDSRLLEFDLY
ncbi:MAG: N-6 DNA methylase [Parachlamydiaceae bacterium]|nr:N-6 DNA methylase [Parachlamydiaceae bacterium]